MWCESIGALQWRVFIIGRKGTSKFSLISVKQKFKIAQIYTLDVYFYGCIELMLKSFDPLVSGPIQI